jgi:two-component system response regulator
MANENPLIDVLLVEDNPDDAELTIHALKEGNKDIHLLHLKDGVEALDFIFAKRAFVEKNIQTDLKLVLLDLKLPKLDGLEVLREIRKNEATKNLPVVILTSSREKRDIAEAYSLAVNSYVVKPVGFDSYVKTVSTLTYYWSLVNEKPV